MIRPAQKADYDQLMHLYNLFVEDDRYSNKNNDSFEKVLNSPSNYIFVAEEGKQLVGFASFSTRNVIRYPKPIAELDELFVLEEFREKGIGKELLNSIEEKAQALDCYRLFIESNYKHETAHKFYESLGYTNYGYHFIKDL